MKRDEQVKHDAIDRILSQEDEILPSSGFAASVMAAVRQEAAAPKPISFPWKRVLPGIVVAGLALIGITLEVVSSVRSTPSLAQPVIESSAFMPMLQTAIRAGAGWVALAILLSLISVKLSMRFASART